MYGIESVTEGFLWTLACMLDHKAQYCGGKPSSKEPLPAGLSVSSWWDSHFRDLLLWYFGIVLVYYAKVVDVFGSVSSWMWSSSLVFHGCSTRLCVQDSHDPPWSTYESCQLSESLPGASACSRTCAGGQWIHLETGWKPKSSHIESLLRVAVWDILHMVWSCLIT